MRGRLDGRRGGRAHEMSAVSAGAVRASARRSGECAGTVCAHARSAGWVARDAIWLALIAGEPREAAAILNHAGVSAGSHDVRATVVSGRQYDELAYAWRATGPAGSPTAWPTGSPIGSQAGGGHPSRRSASRPAAAPGRRRGIVLVVSDRRLLSARVDALACDDKAIAAEFMRILLDSNRQMLATIETAAHRLAWSELGDAMHRINGSLRLFNCGDVVELGARIEHAVARRDPGGVQAVLPIFVSVVRSLNAVLMRALEREPMAEVRRWPDGNLSGARVMR
jgi:HPt (histidine-containing phosphotransfer) domain-containing protein